MEFEWDEEKRKANLIKHALDFKRARTMWDGEVIDPIAERVVAGEFRRTALGILRRMILSLPSCILIARM